MFRQDFFQHILMITAGLALFLHGLAFGSRALREGLGDRARRLLARLGDNRPLSFLLGMFLSLLTQSSTAATSMAVGLVDVGLLPLTGAVVAMMGASVGTTLVILILSLDLVRFSPFFLLGSVFMTRAGGKKTEKTARILMGLSLVLVGMLFLNQGVQFLSQATWLNHLLLAASNRPLLVGLLSFGVTSVIQSNVPVLALTIALAASGSLPLAAALPVVLGGHVGSSSTVLISGFGTRSNARTLAHATLFYKLTGALVVIPLAKFFVVGAEDLGVTAGQQVAWMQILVTGLNALLLLPLAGLMTNLVQGSSRRGKRAPSVAEPLYIDMGNATLTPLALSLLSREMIRLAGHLEELVFSCLQCDETPERRTLEELSHDLSELARSCLEYLLLIPAPPAGSDLGREYTTLSYSMAALKDLVRISSERMLPSCAVARPGEKIWETNDEDWQKLTGSLKELVRQALGSLAIGGTALAGRTAEQYDRYRRAEDEVRSHMLSRSSEASSWSQQVAWAFLSSAGELARACLELAHGESLTPRWKSDGEKTKSSKGR